MPDFVVVDQVALGEPDPNVKGAINHVHHYRGAVLDLTEEQAASYGAAVRRADPPAEDKPAESSDEDSKASSSKKG